VDKSVSLEAVGLREPRVADVTLVRLFARVYSEVPLQFKCVRTSIRTVRALRIKKRVKQNMISRHT